MAAEALLRRALAIRGKYLGPDNGGVASILSQLGVLDYLRHNRVEAESLYERGMRVRGQASPRQSLKYARTLQALGVL